MVTVPRVMLVGLVVASVLGLSASAPSGGPGRQGPRPTTPIEHLVIIQLENWSFDALFGTWPGANGFPGPGTPTPFPQTDKLGNILTSLPGPAPTCPPTPTRIAGTPTPTPTPTTERPGCFPMTV